MSAFKSVQHYWCRLVRSHRLKHLRKQNHNHTFSLITNDCVGGVISHDLGEQFRSPTVNLWIPTDCYLEFVKDLRYYLSCEIEEVTGLPVEYPVGRLVPEDDRHIPIELHFMHYHSFAEAREKWMERRARVDYEHLYFIWHYDGEDCERIREFDRMAIRKLLILHEPIKEIEHAAVTDCYNEDPYNGKILTIIEKTGKRYLDEIDYLTFLNGK